MLSDVNSLTKCTKSIIVNTIHLVYGLYQDGRFLTTTGRIMHKITRSPPKLEPEYEDIILSRILKAYPEQVTKREFLNAIRLYRVDGEEVCEE